MSQPTQLEDDVIILLNSERNLAFSIHTLDAECGGLSVPTSLLEVRCSIFIFLVNYSGVAL